MGETEKENKKEMEKEQQLTGQPDDVQSDSRT